MSHVGDKPCEEACWYRQPSARAVWYSIDLDLDSGIWPSPFVLMRNYLCIVGRWESSMDWLRVERVFFVFFSFFFSVSLLNSHFLQREGTVPLVVRGEMYLWVVVFWGVGLLGGGSLGWVACVRACVDRVLDLGWAIDRVGDRAIEN
ncbi:hypothetical protein K439DRAFT_958267 [Ramaria rubella]|nr:hypothetical protein K439DRAFT_958267 [Ramaria rubella]